MANSCIDPITLDGLSTADRAAFVSALGGIFEHSPWIAEQVWEARSFASIGDLHRAMVRIVHSASAERQLALICAHPELAGKGAADGTLTADSKDEQASADLDRCTSEELARLSHLNRTYREKFGFPFVIAVKDRTKRKIFRELEWRLHNPREAEFRRCLDEIAQIARLRLSALIEQGWIEADSPRSIVGRGWLAREEGNRFGNFLTERRDHP